MSLLEKIYSKSPIFFQNIMTSVAGRKKYKNRYGKTYYKYRTFLEKFDKLSLEEKLDYQNNEFIRFVNYAKENVPFYTKLYKNIDLDEIVTIEDINKLPIVTKEMIRENAELFKTEITKGALVGSTGGTTGKSLQVLFLKEDSMKRMAMLDHFKSRVGFEHLKMTRATFNGKHIIPNKQKKRIYWRYNKPMKQMIYSPFNLSEENMKYYVNSLNKFKPDSIDGFFTAIVDVANYIERNKIELTFKPVAIFPTSETLTEEGRNQIERVFKTKVYDQYASSEGAPFVTECIDQTLHIELSSGIFEKHNDVTNEVLVTSFTTHGTPLIRYQIGDSMTFKNIKCNCGNNQPTILNIEGRKSDYLLTTKGARINGGIAANLFKGVPNGIIRSQIVQDKIDSITILLEIDRKLYNDSFDKLIRQEVFMTFGNDMKLIIRHINEIKREKNGKYRFIINEMSELDVKETI